MPKNNKTYTFNIRRFNISQIPDDSVVILIGKRNTGKSWVAKEILHHYRDIPFGVAISPTDHVNPFFSTFMPKGLIAPEFNPSIIDRVLARQEKMKMIAKKRDSVSSKIDKRAFLILDDCLADSKKWKSSTQVNTVVLNGRHYNILFLLTLQYAKGVPPVIRVNADFIILTKGFCGENLRNIYKEFFGCFDSYSMFKQIINSLGSYECLVLNNLTQSTKLEDKVFWFKAEARNNFRCCANNYWKNKITSINTPKTVSLNDYGKENNKVQLRVNKLN
jgi:hypothetical protein